MTAWSRFYPVLFSVIKNTAEEAKISACPRTSHCSACDILTCALSNQVILFTLLLS
jgi:hypothetical protein